MTKFRFTFKKGRMEEVGIADHVQVFQRLIAEFLIGLDIDSVLIERIKETKP